MTEFKYIYIASSERANRRNDEYRNEFHSNTPREVGDWFTFDGLRWMVEEVKQGA